MVPVTTNQLNMRCGTQRGTVCGLEPPHWTKTTQFRCNVESQHPHTGTMELRQWKHHREMVDFPDQHAICHV